MDEYDFTTLKKQISALGYDIDRVRKEIEITNNILREILKKR